LPIRLTPLTSRPSNASKGGSNVFITFIPGASADSTQAPKRLLFSLLAAISTSGSSGMNQFWRLVRPGLGVSENGASWPRPQDTPNTDPANPGR